MLYLNCIERYLLSILATFLKKIVEPNWKIEKDLMMGPNVFPELPTLRKTSSWQQHLGLRFQCDNHRHSTKLQSSDLVFEWDRLSHKVITDVNVDVFRHHLHKRTHTSKYFSLWVFYVSLFHSLMVLSFSRDAEAMMFSVGWHAVHNTTSVWPCSFWTTSLVCKFQMYTR